MEDFNAILAGLLQNGKLGIDLYNQIKNNPENYILEQQRKEEEAKRQTKVLYFSFAIIILLVLVLVYKVFYKK